MKLAQALEASQEHCACLVVGTLRILIQFRMHTLRVLVQHRMKQRWVLTDSSGGVRYLNGVLRDVDGSWVIDRCDVAALDLLACGLPAAYQHLLAPNSDDWQIIGRKEQGE